MADQSPDLLGMTADVVAAFVSNNPTPASELPSLIQAVHLALAGAGQVAAAPEPEPARATPAQIRRSIRPDGLISFEDGRPYKTLKRHLATRGLTFAEYRDKWGLPADYPSVAPDYAARRSEIARSLGLGQKGHVARKAAPRSRTRRK